MNDVVIKATLCVVFNGVVMDRWWFNPGDVPIVSFELYSFAFFFGCFRYNL